MADNYLITGYHGTPHVTAENDRGIFAGIFGAGRFVLPVGEQFRAEYIGNNTVRVYDGKLIDNGAAAGIPAGKYVDVLISEAAQGMNRNDLIVFQYEKNNSTLIESGSFVVVKGEETTGTASDPVLTQEDLLTDEATFDQMALWRVSVSTANISAPVKVFDIRSLSGTPDNEKHVAYAETAGTAKKAESSMVIRANGGQTEDTDKWTYDGSKPKNIDITPEKIGAAKSAHNHSAADINSGTMALERLPLGDIIALHIWKKYPSAPNSYSLGTSKSVSLGLKVYSSVTLSYSDKVECVDGKCKLVDSVPITSANVADFDVLKGKFVSKGSASDDIYSVSPSATLSIGTNGLDVSSAQLLIPNANTFAYVTSQASNTYPASGKHSDGYWYEYCKQLGDTDAPDYTYGTTDLTDGTSALETGKLYFVYE